MVRIVMTAEVEDVNKWEQGFRTHGELFKSQAIVSPYKFAINPETKHVSLSAHVKDLDKFREVLESPATAEAMKYDGVKRETTELFVLDKEFDFAA